MYDCEYFSNSKYPQAKLPEESSVYIQHATNHSHTLTKNKEKQGSFKRNGSAALQK